MSALIRFFRNKLRINSIILHILGIDRHDKNKKCYNTTWWSAEIFIHVRDDWSEVKSRYNSMQNSSPLKQLRVDDNNIPPELNVQFKMQMSDSPPSPPSPPLLHSWSLLWFIHFLCWWARQDNGVFHNWGHVPTTSTLQSPRVPHPPGQCDVTWPWRTGSSWEGNTEREIQMQEILHILHHRRVTITEMLL